ncbi:divergent PAP2 family protein [Angelakisella massiliensis]|uniref:divergent PAP2 family protein n=1 Tax=Angelakisella massiliensis TaxID=1871018 RepID=UPI0008F808D7|nr:divergent PAP2 family protein [Angelakisella massiliensis]
MGSTWKAITSNYIINLAFISWSLAQVIKTLLTLIQVKEFRAERLFGAGGMPSSHSALVCSITVGMAKLQGYDSPLFALTLCFAAVVMYDAMGVRRAAGEQAKVLNKMIFSFKDISKVFDLLNEEIEEEYNENTDNIVGHKELKEYLGHTPLEVFGGALLGILIASLLPMPV